MAAALRLWFCTAFKFRSKVLKTHLSQLFYVNAVNQKSEVVCAVNY